jgi:hypothetical protein
MRRLLRVICRTAAAATMTACGSQGPAGSPSNSPSRSSVFPLTITRVGGVAGFHDVMVVTSDGLVSVTQKGKAPRQCRLTPEAAKRVTTAASQVPWPHLTSGKTTATFPDDMVTMVLSPAGGPVRVEDPQVGAAGPVFTELANELNGGQSASGMCTPV